MPKWIKSIYGAVLSKGIPANQLAFSGGFEAGKFIYILYQHWANPCGEEPMHSIQEFIKMKEDIKSGRANKKNSLKI